MGSNRVRRQQREEQKQSRRTTGHDASNAKDKYKEQREEFVRANKITPMNKKQASYLHALQDPDISVIVATGHAGCVDKDTEFLSQYGWKKISEYVKGDLVTQVSEIGLNASLVEPLDYIKKECDTFYHFKTDRGIDQMLSSEHNVAYTIKNKNKLNKKRVSNILSLLEDNTTGFNGKIPCTFNFKGKSLELSEQEIRLGVAIKADAYLATKSTGRYIFRLKKERKIQRLLNLLKLLNKEYNLKYEESTGFSIISFYSNHTKSYEDWMFCSKKDALIIMDEYQYWDGDSNPSGNRLSRFSCKSKKEADVMQYIMSISGYRTTISESIRDCIFNIEDKTYEYKDNKIYIVTPTKQTHISLTPINRSSNTIIKPEKIKVKNEHKYCFEVPTGFLLLRRNNKIFVTGNTSKTFIPTAFSCLEYLQNRVYKIAFSRPAISNSKSLGFFAGDKNEKMSIWLAPVLSTVKQYLTSGVTEIAIKKEDIVFYPLEIIKGLSLGSTVEGRRMFFIVDEAEDLTIDEVKKIITRVGKNCTLVLAGDITQSELKENSGLKWLINFYEKHDLKGFYHIDFNDVNDIVRSDTVKSFITALQRETKTKKEETNNNGTNSKTNS